MNIVVLAPHPDDEIIGAGGSIVRHVSRGDRVTTVHIVARDRGLADDDISDADYAREISQANRILGVAECVRLDQPPRDLRISRELRLAVVAVLRRTRPDIVYLPHEDEADQEHAAVHQLGLDAIWMSAARFFGEAGAEPAPMPGLVLGYEVWTPMRRFQLAEDISDTLGRKVEAMRAYQSQLKHAAWDLAIAGLAAYRGAVAFGSGHAEVFQVLRMTNSALPGGERQGAGGY